MAHHNKSLGAIVAHSAGRAAGRRIIDSGLAEDTSIATKHFLRWTVRYTAMLVVLGAGFFWENFNGAFILSLVYVAFLFAYDLAANDAQRITLHRTMNPLIGAALLFPAFTGINALVEMFGLSMYGWVIGFVAWTALTIYRLIEGRKAKDAPVDPHAAMQAEIYGQTWRFTKAPRPDAADAMISLVDPNQWVTVKDDYVALRLADDFDMGSDTAKANLQKTIEARMKRTYSAEWMPVGYPDWVVFTEQKPLPKLVKHDLFDADQWTTVFGATYGEKAVEWDMDKTPHGLVSGQTGSGKTVFLRTLILDKLRHGWHVVACDPKSFELSFLEGRRNCTFADDLEEMSARIQGVRDLMDDRRKARKANGNLQMTPFLLVVDEATMLLRMAKAAGDTTVEENIGAIARLGRSLNIRMVIGMQRPDAKDALPGEIKLNLDFRLALGRHDVTASGMVLDSDKGRTIDGTVKGRGMARISGDFVDVQTMWLDTPESSSATGAYAKTLFDRFAPMLPVKPAAKAAEKAQEAPTQPAPSFVKEGATAAPKPAERRRQSA